MFDDLDIIPDEKKPLVKPDGYNDDEDLDDEDYEDDYACYR